MDGKYQFHLTSFPYTASFSTNTTLNANICYAQTVEKFKSDCGERNEDGKWILLTPFNFKETNEFLKKVKALNIEVVVIQHDGKIDARGYY